MRAIKLALLGLFSCACVQAVPSPPAPCGTLDLANMLTQHCFPEDGELLGWGAGAAAGANGASPPTFPAFSLSPDDTRILTPSLLSQMITQGATTLCAALTSRCQKTPTARMEIITLLIESSGRHQTRAPTRGAPAAKKSARSSWGAGWRGTRTGWGIQGTCRRRGWGRSTPGPGWGRTREKG